MRGKGHDDVALVDGPEILTGEVELAGPTLLLADRLLVLVLAKSVLVYVQEKLGRRPLDLWRPTGRVPRPIRQSEQIQYLVLDLPFLALADHPVHDGLVETVVDVEAAHPVRRGGARQPGEDRAEDQQGRETARRHLGASSFRSRSARAGSHHPTSPRFHHHLHQHHLPLLLRRRSHDDDVVVVAVVPIEPPAWTAIDDRADRPIDRPSRTPRTLCRCTVHRPLHRNAPLSRIPRRLSLYSSPSPLASTPPPSTPSLLVAPIFLFSLLDRAATNFPPPPPPPPSWKTVDPNRSDRYFSFPFLSRQEMNLSAHGYTTNPEVDRARFRTAILSPAESVGWLVTAIEDRFRST